MMQFEIIEKEGLERWKVRKENRKPFGEITRSAHIRAHTTATGTWENFPCWQILLSRSTTGFLILLLKRLEVFMVRTRTMD